MLLISYKYFSYCNIKKHNNNLKFFIMKFLNMPAKRGFQIRNFWSIWGHSFRLNFIDFSTLYNSETSVHALHGYTHRIIYQTHV